MSVFTVLSDLSSNNSRNFKLAYLSKYANNELVKRVFAMALDPMLVFYIKKIPVTNSLDEPNLLLDEALTMLYDLSNRNVTGNAAIGHLKTILCNLSNDDAEVIKRVVKKDLRCGVSTATAAAIWPEFSSFTFPVMLASAFDQKLIDKLQYPVYVQQKMDGCLSSNWVLDTVDGKKTIQEVVDSNYKGKVKGFNHQTQTDEYRSITNMSKNKTSKRWFVLTLANGMETPPLTGNHLVWVPSRGEYVRVDDLTCNDFVQLSI